MIIVFYAFWFNVGLMVGMILTIIPILLVRAIFQI